MPEQAITSKSTCTRGRRFDTCDAEVERGTVMYKFMSKHATRWLLLLGLGELLLLAISLNVAMYLRYFQHEDELAEFSRHMPERSLIFGGVLLLGLAALGQYQAHMRTSWFGLLARQAVGFVLGGFGLVVAYYIVPQAYVGRGVLSIALVLGFVAVTGFRAAFLRLVDVDVFKRRVLILGVGTRAAQIHNRMRRRSDRRGFIVAGFVPRPGETIAVPAEYVLTADAPLHVLAQREQVDEIVVGVEDRRGGLPIEDLLECRQLGIDVTDMTTFFEREAGRLHCRLPTHPGLSFRAASMPRRCACSASAASMSASPCWCCC
ncbi:MAG TPA: hypothetical protein VGG00_06765 [Rhodanobacter sp.]